MLRGMRAGVLVLLLAAPAFAEEGASPTPSTGVPVASEAAPANMQEPRPGDRWTYEVKDDISGALKVTRTDMVTDVSKDDIAVRVDTGAGGTRNIVYDHSWDIVRDGPFKYTPNDGTGIRPPLTVGAQWKFSIDAMNARSGLTFRRSGSTKVVGQETITTKAGPFNTFVIETDFTGKNVQDRGLINQNSWRTWFAPEINHWVKRSTVWRQDGHVVSRDTLELTQYSRAKRQ